MNPLVDAATDCERKDVTVYIGSAGSVGGVSSWEKTMVPESWGATDDDQARQGHQRATGCGHNDYHNENELPNSHV